MNFNHLVLLILLLGGIYFPLGVASENGQPLGIKGGVIDAVEDSGSIRLDFAKEDVKAAVFFKDGRLWMFFNDRISNNMVPSLQRFWQPSDYQLVVEPNYSLILVKVSRMPNLFKSGKSWVIDFKGETSVEGKPIFPQDGDHKVFFDLGDDNAEVSVVMDPISGNELMIVPGNYRVEKGHKYAHIDILETKLGIVVQAMGSGVDMKPHEKGVMVEYSGLKHSSSSHDRDYLESPIYGFKYLVAEDKDYAQREAELRYKIIETQVGDSKLDRRLELVKFYIANGLYREAYQYLDYMKLRDFTVETNYMFQLLSCAAMFLNGQWENAYKNYSKINLEDFSDAERKEIEMWRSAARFKMGDAKEKIEYDQLIALQYAEPDELALIAFQSAIKNSDEQQVAFLQDILLARDLSPNNRNRFRLLLASLITLLDDPQKAMALYDKVSEDVADPKHRMQAVLESARYLYQEGTYTFDDVIDALSQVRVIWRGNMVEAELREWLGDLLIQIGDYRDGLSTLRSLYLDFPNGYNIFPVLAKMSEVFLYLFAEGGIKGMNPFSVVTLFIDFQDLLPIGRKGTDATLLFVDYLLELDLIESASSILVHLIRHKLDDDLRAQNVIKLAQTYIRDRRPQEAVLLLEEYDAGTPDSKRLKSYALMKSERYIDAESVIEDDLSEAANKIRSDIFWYSKHWEDLITFGENMLEFRADPEKPLSQLELQLVFRLATSYIMVDDKMTLMRLYDAFKQMMDRNLVYKEAFDTFHKMAAVYDQENSYIDSIAALIAKYTASLANV